MSKHTLAATCSICGYTKEFQLNDKEFDTYAEYIFRGREMGTLQSLFPRVPAWIRSGCIDKYSSGFCICPNCSE